MSLKDLNELVLADNGMTTDHQQVHTHARPHDHAHSHSHTHTHAHAHDHAHAPTPPRPRPYAHAHAHATLYSPDRACRRADRGTAKAEAARRQWQSANDNSCRHCEALFPEVDHT